VREAHRLHRGRCRAHRRPAGGASGPTTNRFNASQRLRA
jgi:hypothetical protein